MRVEVIQAWPRRHASVVVELPQGATVSVALAACGLDLSGIEAYAIHGERVARDAALRDGDRLELLRPLPADPKEARRLRAQKTKV